MAFNTGETTFPREPPSSEPQSVEYLGWTFSPRMRAMAFNTGETMFPP